MSRGRAWTLEEDVLLTKLWRCKVGDQELVRALPGRSINSIKHHASVLGLGRRDDIPDPDDSPLACFDRIEVPYDDPLLARLRAKHTLAEATREFLDG